MTLGADLVAQGLSLAAVLLLSSLGLTVIYGVMGVVNLAHGEFVMLGAYTVALLAPYLSTWGAFIAAPVVVAIVGVGVDRTIVRWMYQNPIKSMLGTYALGIIIRQLVVLTIGPQLQSVTVPIQGNIAIGFGADIAAWRFVLIGLAAAVALVVAVWMTRTRAGLRVRVCSAEPDVAQSLGLNVQTVSCYAFAAGAGLAGIAGALVAPLNSVSPDMGVPYLTGAFLVVVLAGLGNVQGAAAWSVVVGLATAAVAIPFDDVTAQICVWGSALALVALRRRSDLRV